MTSKQGTNSTRPFNNEYHPIHSRNSKSCLKNNTINERRSPSSALLESINHYYTSLGGTRETMRPDTDLNGCFAVRLALFLAETISGNRFRLDEEGCFTGSFYRHCLDKAAEAGLADEINDPELLVIYMKQCLRLLDTSGILSREKRWARVNGAELSASTIYHRLFNAFWNITPWEDLFPSDSESARELKTVRGIFKELLLRRHGTMSLGAVANEFFEMTGFSSKNNLFMISFLDFYLFTWLRHFGMVRYLTEGDSAPVRITVTDSGRKSLNSF